MAERVRRAWTAWKRLSFARKIRLFGYAVLLIAAVELVVVSSVYDQLLPFWQGFLINLGTDALGVAITVLVLNALQERAQEEQLKKQLIREMGSKIRDVAVPASEEMTARGWLRDGSLAGAILEEPTWQEPAWQERNLEGANLEGANLAGANLAGAHLAGANLAGANLEEPTWQEPTWREPTWWEPSWRKPGCWEPTWKEPTCGEPTCGSRPGEPT